MINLGAKLFVLAGLMGLSLLVLSQEGQQETEEVAPPSGVESESGRTSPGTDIFIPSEEIAADEEVIFPVDI